MNKQEHVKLSYVCAMRSVGVLKTALSRIEAKTTDPEIVDLVRNAFETADVVEKGTKIITKT